MSQNLLSKPVHPQRYLSIVCDKRENVNFAAREEIRKFESRDEGLGTRDEEPQVTSD